MRLLLLGHGRMGQLVEQLAPAYGGEVVAVLDETTAPASLARFEPTTVDVAVDFTAPEAVPRNLPVLLRQGIAVVVGTTGWREHETGLREATAAAGGAVLAAANFSLGMNVFQLLVEDAARRMLAIEDYGAWIHELHHAAKLDAPSGTALQLQAGMQRAGYGRRIDVASTRAGSIPGTHSVGFDGPSDAITLTHSVRDRAVFARGALEAARWLQGRRGWFTMRDMLEDSWEMQDARGKTRAARHET